MTDLTTFQRKLAERRAREMAAVQPKEETPAEFSDVIPEDDTSYERSEDDIAIDRLIEKITVDQAYDRWIRKPRPKERTGKREGVMISCPKPDHADRNPSAWMNLDKNTWYCAGCDVGGDVLDLAAIHFGWYPDYKSGENFGRLREEIAEDFGFTRIHAPGLPRGGALVAPEPEEDGTSLPAAPPTTPEEETVDAGSDSNSDGDGRDDQNVTYLPEGLAAEEGRPDENLPGLAWRDLVEPGTFLDAYMAACVIDDVPEEYHFWHGMLALGLAVGRDVTLFDYKPVLANLFVCTLGRTGIGKSRAASYLKELISRSIPEVDRNDASDRGARHLPTPGSAEVLIHNFNKPITQPHPTTGKPVLIGHAPVRGLVEFTELSGLLGRSSRSGSVLKPILMDFFDGNEEVSTSSLSNGDQIAKGSFASLLTSTQPKALQTLLDQNDANSGFLNRWVFVTGTEKKRVSVGGARIDLTHAIIALRDVWIWAGPKDPSDPPRMLQWSDDAFTMFDAFFQQEIERVKKGDSEDEREFYQRLDLLIKKVILLFTVNERRDEVHVSAVEKAIKIFWYLVKVLEIPSQSIGRNLQSDLEQDIMNLLRRYEEKNGKEGACPMSYITKLMTKKKVYQLDMISRALKTLTELNLITIEKPTKKPGPGRDYVSRYRLASHE